MADVGCIDVIDRVLFLINLLVLAFLLRLRVPLAKTANVEKCRSVGPANPSTCAGRLTLWMWQAQVIYALLGLLKLG